MLIFCFYPLLQGFQLQKRNWKIAAENSGVLQLNNDFISPEFRAKCTNIIPYPDQVEPNECYDAFIYLKTNFNCQTHLPATKIIKLCMHLSIVTPLTIIEECWFWNICFQCHHKFWIPTSWVLRPTSVQGSGPVWLSYFSREKIHCFSPTIQFPEVGGWELQLAGHNSRTL